MSVQTQNTNLNPYSNTPIKNLEYIQNKALVIAPFEITKSGKLDPDLLLDTPGFITMNLYKKMVSGEDKEPTSEQFKTIKTMSDLELSGLNNEVLISTSEIPVIFKYDKGTGTRIIEKDNKDLSGAPLDSDYIDLTIDIENVDFSSETGSGGFFCVCQVQKIQKPVATTAFTEVANDDFLFMIPSVECREIPELVEFDLLDSDNKVINIKRFGEQEQGYRIHPIMNISDHVNAEESTTPKFYLGSKYQRNLMEVLAPALKTKRPIYNLKDMYLVDDICLATLQKINQQLELDSMIKLTERLYNAGITEKINAEYLLEFITSSVANSNNYNCNQIIVDSLIGDYLFTQEEIDNLNSNLNTFKNRARLTIPVVTIAGDQFKFNLPTSFVDSNRSGSLKTNLVIFGTDKGFDKYSLISGTIPMYSDITKLETPRVLNDLISTVPTLAGLKNGNIESYLTTNLPRIFTRTTDIGVTDISSNVQKAPGLLSDVDANGIRGIYSNINTGSYIAANNFNFGTGDFTIEFDLKSTISQVNPFFVIGEQGSACNLLVYFQSNNSLLFRAGLNVWGWDFSSDRLTPAGSILPGVYYHVVFQRTNGVLDIYIDGVKIHTSAWAYNIEATSNIWFGSHFGGGGHTNYRFNNFEVYKRAKYTGNFNSKTRYGLSDKFKSILTDYKQRLPFTYIPLSTNMDDVGSKPVFENLTDITGFNRSDIVIDIPNVL